jgi:FkbM family methyltransferase
MEDTERIDLEPGHFYIFKNDTGVSESIRTFKNYAFEEVQFYDQVMRDDDYFFDAGCNIGAVSFFLKKRNPKINVIGFEAQPRFHQLCCVNLFDFDGVEVINAAVESEETIISTGVPQTQIRDNYGSSSINTFHERFSRTISLRMDDFARDRNILPKLVKIDVENSTLNAFRGCSGLFDRGVMFSIEADRASQARQIIDLVQASKGAMCLKIFQNVDRAKHSPQDEGYWTSSPHIIVSFSSSNKVHLDPNTMFETFEEFAALLPFDIHD